MTIAIATTRIATTSATAIVRLPLQLQKDEKRLLLFSIPKKFLKKSRVRDPNVAILWLVVVRFCFRSNQSETAPGNFDQVTWWIGTT